jgi:hypothetical protein
MITTSLLASATSPFAVNRLRRLRIGELAVV